MRNLGFEVFPYWASKSRSGKVLYLAENALVVFYSVKIERENTECLNFIQSILGISRCSSALVSPHLVDIPGPLLTPHVLLCLGVLQVELLRHPGQVTR